MRKLIVASNNEHKIKEIKQILSSYNIEIKSLKESGINIDVEETGKTFMENAYIKAKAIKDIAKDYMVLADDSGLMVDALGGRPGVYSARYSGEHGDYKKNNEKLLRELEGIKSSDRGAKFCCAIILIDNYDQIIRVQGEIKGVIIDEERGNDGFGYDPLFYVPEFNKTFAEMNSDEKNSISHRGRALEKLKNEISKVFEYALEED